MKKDVSIIVPVFNVSEKLLRSCLESLIVQQGKNIEFIIVDDGSKDVTAQICDEYGKRDKRFKVIHQKNKGLSGARNTGVSLANSDWFMFLDGDDFLERDSIIRLYPYLKKDVDVIIFGTIKHYLNSKINYNYNNHFENGIVYDKNYMLNSILDFKNQIEDATAKLYRKKFIDDNKIYHDEKIQRAIEGLEYTFRVFSKAEKTLFVEEFLYNYEYNENSITMSVSGNKKNIKYLEYGFNQIKNTIRSNNFDYLYDAYYTRLLYIIVGGAIGFYFSPNNKKKYRDKVIDFKKYLKINFINEGLVKGKIKRLDYKRKIIIILIKLKIFFPLAILGIIRKWQKEK